MKFAILAGSKNYKEVNQILEEKAKKYFDKVRIAPIKELKPVARVGETTVIHKEEDLSDYDAIFPRISAPDTVPAYIAIDILVDRGVYSPIQPDGMLIAKNKFYTLKAAAQAGIPCPRSALIISPKTVDDVVKEFKFPVVVKLLGGAGGKGVMLIKTPDELSPVIETMDRLNQIVAVEEFIENPGEDHRLFVVGDQVVAAERRKATKEGEFRANIAVGGKSLAYKPKDEEVEIAIKAAETVGLEICGVDILQGKDGFYLIEINDGPGLKGISKVTKVDLYDKIVSFIHKKAKGAI